MAFRRLTLSIVATIILALTPITMSAIKGAFIQIGDMHYDPTYGEEGDSCNTKIPRDQMKPYGNYECDGSLKLAESACEKVNNLAQEENADFIMWAGDISPHVRDPSMLDTEKVLNIINTTSMLIRQKVYPDIPIFPMMGNHDYFPKSQLPTSDGLYAQIAGIFCSIFRIPEGEGCETFTKAGYYSHVLENKVMLLITNTNLYSKSNQKVSASDPDPAGQFAWMRKMLSKARTTSLKVHVFAHVPPGYLETVKNNMMFSEGFNKIFNDVIRQFSDVIIGVYGAHTHTDSFRIYYKDDKPVVPILISPSVTPWRWEHESGPLPRNPAIRAVIYDPSQLYLKNYKQYYLRLDFANSKSENEKVEWDLEYSFTSYKRAQNATAKALHEMVDEFSKYGSSEFHTYFERNSVLIVKAEDKPVGLKYYCNSDCKKVHICTMANVETEEYSKCLETIAFDSATGTFHWPLLTLSMLFMLMLF